MIQIAAAFDSDRSGVLNVSYTYVSLVLHFFRTGPSCVVFSIDIVWDSLYIYVTTCVHYIAAHTADI